MNTSMDVYDYFKETGHNYCRYDFDMEMLKVRDVVNRMFCFMFINC